VSSMDRLICISNRSIWKFDFTACRIVHRVARNVATRRQR
jgi:hypothetical protein